MPDQRGVDDEEERLGDERAERGHGETEDVAVQRAVGSSLSSLEGRADAGARSDTGRGIRRHHNAVTASEPQRVGARDARAGHILERMTEAPRSGLALDELSAEIRPQDDLFRHVNGAWLERTEIPEDKARWGSFHLIAEQAEKDVHAIVEESQDAEPGTEARKIGDLYTSFMDTERISRSSRGSPLDRLLARVDAIDSIPAFLRTIGELERDGVAALVHLYIEPDPGNPQRYVPFFIQGGLSLPDESYYRLENFQATRTAFRAHVQTMLELAGVPEADGIRRSHRGARDRARHPPLGQRQEPRRRRDLQPEDRGTRSQALVGVDLRPVARGHRARPPGRVRRGERVPAELPRGSRLAARRGAARGLEGVAAVLDRPRERAVPLRRVRRRELRASTARS